MKGGKGEALMILFEGTADCDNFKGRVLPGAVDTQKEIYGSVRTLSARYILEGRDKSGKECRIFVENNGAAKNGKIEETTPIVLTDSSELKYLETEKLAGAIAPTETGVVIRIFLENE